MTTILKISSVTQATVSTILVFIAILSVIANILLVVWRLQLEACGPSPVADALSLLSFNWLFFIFLQVPAYIFSLAVPLVTFISTVRSSRALKITSVILSAFYLLFNGYVGFMIWAVYLFNPGGPSPYSMVPAFSIVRALLSLVLMVTTSRALCCGPKDRMGYDYESLKPVKF